MQIRIIAVGKIKERFLQDGIAEYVKRLKPYVNLQISDVHEEKRSKTSSLAAETGAVEKEGERILAAIPSGFVVIVMDQGGQGWSSEKLAASFREWELSGKQVAFVIGGDLGLSPNVCARSDMRLSLSLMTFTHPMARLLLVEQIYRAFRILRGEPYHK
jgi:23S rRNA (pseudouridine1915-N3)-methyltransferase